MLFTLEVSAGSPYTTVDPYSGYATAAYGYPTAPGSAGAPPTSISQTAYPSSYSSTSSSGSYAYDSKRPMSPPTSSTLSTHYSAYDYASNIPGTLDIHILYIYV